MDNMNLDQVITLNEAQARARYNIGRKRLVDVATKAHALVKLGIRKNLYIREKLDEYLVNQSIDKQEH